MRYRIEKEGLYLKCRFEGERMIGILTQEKSSTILNPHFLLKALGQIHKDVKSKIRIVPVPYE